MKLFYALLTLFVFGCGVKGDPKPPLTPVSLGHGQPSFKRATKPLPTPQTQESEPAPRKTIDDSEQE